MWNYKTNNGEFQWSSVSVIADGVDGISKSLKVQWKTLFFSFLFFSILLCWKDFLSEKKAKSEPVTLHVAIGRCRNAPVRCSVLEQPVHSRMIASFNSTRIGSPFSPQHRYWHFFFLFQTQFIVHRHNRFSCIFSSDCKCTFSRTHALNSSFSSLCKAKSTFKTVSSASLTEFELTRE